MMNLNNLLKIGGQTMIKEVDPNTPLTMSVVKFTFNSPFMINDTLTYENINVEEARQKYLNWWRGYGRDEHEAMKVIISVEVKK